MLKLSSVLALSALAIRHVDGGSRMWESPLHYKSQDEPVEIKLSLEGNNVTILGVDTSSISDNGTESSNDKRWVSIKNAGQNQRNKSYRWPDKTITFHFKDETAKDRLSGPLDAAKAMWAVAGLPPDFRYEEVEDEEEYQSRKGAILLISYNTEGFLATSLGRPTENDNGPSPEMKLSDSTSIGTLNVIANFAHELGHAWGMHHEHQNPQFWTDPYSEANGNRVQFGEGHGPFNCEALSDYEATRRRLIADGGEGRGLRRLESACTSRAAAIEHGFRGAMEWLPLDDGEDFVASEKPFDKLSIMLYPSQAGGKGGVSQDGTDNRESVLEFPNGEKLPINTVPSRQDVEGLKKLYNVKRGGFKSFLSESSDASNSRFEAVRAEDLGQSCSNRNKKRK